MTQPIKTALISAVAVGTALLGAAPAQADTAQDARFLDEAAKHGFGSYNGSGHLLDMAQGVCLGLDALPTSWRNIVIAVEVLRNPPPVAIAAALSKKDPKNFLGELQPVAQALLFAVLAPWSDSSSAARTIPYAPHLG